MAVEIGRLQGWWPGNVTFTGLTRLARNCSKNEQCNTGESRVNLSSLHQPLEGRVMGGSSRTDFGECRLVDAALEISSV